MSRIATLLKQTTKLVSDNTPAILTGVAVAGVVTTSILVAKASPKAHRDILDAESERTEPLTVIEKAKLTWPYYVPSVVVGAATISCIIGANTISTKRQAALTSAYMLSEKVFKEYRDKVEETIGETKEGRIRDAIAQDRIDADPPVSSQVIMTGKGKVLCKEAYTGRYFECSHDSLRKAENEINSQIINDGYASQNDFNRLIGLPQTKIGDELGWNTNKLLELDILGGISEDGEPVLVIDYRVEPNRGFNMFGR